MRAAICTLEHPLLQSLETPLKCEQHVHDFIYKLVAF